MSDTSGTLTTARATPVCDWEPGAHQITFEAFGVCPGSGGTGTAETTVSYTLDVQPHVDTVTYSNGTLSADFRFPNADPNTRLLRLFVDDVETGQPYLNPPGSGTWSLPLDTTCWRTGSHRFDIRATVCARFADERYNDGNSDTTSVDTTPTVDIRRVVEPDGSSKLAVPFHFPNSGPSGSNRRIELYRNGETEPFVTNQPNAAEGTWMLTYDAACAEAGSHEIRALAIACNQPATDEAYVAQARTQIQIDPRPDVSLSETATDTITITYAFSDTPPGGRSIGLYLDGVLAGTFQAPQPSGSIPVPVSSGCWQTARAVATACGLFTAEDKIHNEADAPMLSVAVMKSTDLSLGSFEAHITYAFAHDVPGRFVKITNLAWIDAAGNEHSGGEINAALVDDSGPLSGTVVHHFNPPSASARRVILYAVAQGCGTVTESGGADCDLCQATADPVFLSDGNMRLTDTDPLPPIAGVTLVRTYDSDEQQGGVLGRGFTSILDQRLMKNTIDGREVVSLITSTNEMVAFERSGNSHVQKWPKEQLGARVLSQDAAAGTYSYRRGDSMDVMVFRAGDGRLIAVRDLATGHEARITYDGSLPETVTDSWTGVAWTLAFANGRVATIAVNDLTWTYDYDENGNLLTVLAPGGTTWRTYEYAGNRMTASRDAAGNLIESHAFDSAGYATSSTGSTDEIESIQYNLSGSNASERITRVTMKTGAATDYVLRPSGGTLRVVQIIGGCATCGGAPGDRTYVRDKHGRVLREQGPDGFITIRTYAGDRLSSEEGPLQAAGCDPAACRLTTDALAAATLQPTGATITTEYTYADARWPDKPTRVSTPSIASAGRWRREDIAYHPIAGTVMARSLTGFAGAEPALEPRGTTTSLYEQRASEDEGSSGFAPAFDPGGAFQSAWLALPQPAFLTRSIDGPRADADVTSFVYYPIHDSVPPLLRGRLAATRNAAGHIMRYEGYDVFGNATRTVDPNGVVTETELDVLGRLKTATIKGSPGCNPSKDALCAVDLTSTRAYSPASGPLHGEHKPGGGVTVYEYDDRGRVRLRSRGPSATDLRERMETVYDPPTGKKSLERILAYDSGQWIEKNRQSFTYDSLGRLSAVIHADGSRIEYTYDAAGRLASIEDETHDSPNTTYSYDPAGRLETVRQKLASAPGGWITTGYTYDRHGNLTSVRDPNGNLTGYAYDDFGQLVRQSSAVTGVTKYEYDQAGSLIRIIDANGIATDRVYDALGRVVSATSGLVPAEPGEDDGREEPPPPPTTSRRPETVMWTYDDATAGRYGIGRLATMTDPAGTTAYDYERRGLLTEERRTFAGCFVTRDSGMNCEESFESRTFVTSYRYDRDGNRTTVDYPSHRLKVNYSFDHAGRPLSASGTVSAAEYLPFGPLARIVFANGTTQSFGYDSRYRVRENMLSTAASTLALSLPVRRCRQHHRRR